MTISFNSIPTNIRVPLAFVEFDSTMAREGSRDLYYRILVLGQMLGSGSAAPETPVQVTSAARAETLFGRGSMLAGMFDTEKDNAPYIEVWAIPQEDDDAGVAASGAITIGGAPTAAGVINLYIAGIRVRISVAAAEAVATTATALAAAINADTSLPVTAAAAAGVVTLTARNEGECGNDIDVRTNYYQGEELPAGTTVTIVDMSGGAANPDISDAIAAMGDEWYHAIAMPYTDAANLTLLETELANRFGGVRMIDGMAYAAYRGTHSATETFGDGRNSKHVTCMGTDASPTPPCRWAAAYAAQAAAALSVDPARPLQTLVLNGILPPEVGDKWTQEERNLLLYDGIATHYVDAGGNVRIERAITMYQQNVSGVEDDAYLDVTTPATLSYFRYDLRSTITSKYPRHKLADDGTDYDEGQAIVTPSVLKGEALTIAKRWEKAGLLEDYEAFKEGLIVERNENNRNRVDFLIPPDIVNQFRMMAAQVQFRL